MIVNNKTQDIDKEVIILMGDDLESIPLPQNPVLRRNYLIARKVDEVPSLINMIDCYL